MLRLPTRLLSSTLALIALVLLLPALATAQPQREAIRSPAERTATASSLLAEIRSLLSILWAETGSGLEPNGITASSAPGSEPNATTYGDTGSGLEPNG
jgi:hypothetical protein